LDFLESYYNIKRRYVLKINFLKEAKQIIMSKTKGKRRKR